MIPFNTCQYQRRFATRRDYSTACKNMRGIVLSRNVEPSPNDSPCRLSSDKPNSSLFEKAKLHVLVMTVGLKHKKRLSVNVLSKAKFGFAFPQLQQDYLLTQGVAAPTCNGKVLVYGKVL